MPGIDINYFIRQANKLTEKIEERKKSLSAETVEGQAGDGRVKVVVSCNQDVKSIKIDKAAVDPSDPSLLEDLLVAALNAALEKSKSQRDQELQKVTGGVKIPGM